MILKVNNREEQFWDEVDVTLIFDSTGSTFSFTGFYDSNNSIHRALFKPYAYSSVQVLSDNRELLITGVTLNNGFSSAKDKILAKVSGYSKTGVLNDCQIPVDQNQSYQFDGLTLKEITEKLIEPFSLNLIVDSSVAADVDTVFDVTTIEPSSTIKSYLSSLATQKNVILTHDAIGNLIYTRANGNKKPIASLSGLPGTNYSVSCAGKGMHSTLTLMKQADLENDNAGESSITNPYVSAFRPRTKIQTSGDDIETEKAARSLLGQEVKNTVLTITTSQWEFPGGGGVIKPNNIISVQNPELFLNKKTNFFIEKVNLKGDSKEQIAIMTCVPVDAYTEDTVVNIFN